MAGLSKSRIMSSLQCLKKVHLEVHHKDLARYSATTRAAFDEGHAVGEAAIEVYGGDAGALIPFRGGLARAVRQTRELMDGLFKTPIFEATLEYEGVLVREDILLPAGDSWRMVEIKASTSVKDIYLQDCAIQAWVHTGAGYPLQGVALGHVDNTWVYPGDGDYSGLIVETDLSEPVNELLPSVPHWVEDAKAAAAGPLPDVPVGAHCFKPYECPFVAHCWPGGTPYPVTGLGGLRRKHGDWVAAGYRDIRDVPLEELNERQQWIARLTHRGEAEVRPGLGAFLRALPYPRHALDFETVAPAVPVWAGTRPYQVLPFQYSCHTEHADGGLEHREFLDLSGAPPMRALTEQLIEDLGADGPVLAYSSYEQQVIAELARLFPDLAPALEAITERLVDLLPPIRQHYYHPDMLGSWSIKAVLPTVAPDMDYGGLDGVAEGTQASAAFLAAIRPGIDTDAQAQIAAELRTYCRHDTLAMIRLVQHFSRF